MHLYHLQMYSNNNILKLFANLLITSQIVKFQDCLIHLTAKGLATVKGI